MEEMRLQRLQITESMHRYEMEDRARTQKAFRFGGSDWRSGSKNSSGESQTHSPATIPAMDPIVVTPDSDTDHEPLLQDTITHAALQEASKSPEYTLSSSTHSMVNKQHLFRAPVKPASTQATRPTLGAQSSSPSSSSASTRSRARRLSSEEIINEMENEQDAIVVRLLREIDQLKDENNRLRKNLCAVLNGDPLTPATSSLSRRSSLNSSASNNSSNSSLSTSHTGSSAGVFAAVPGGTSPALSRRPSSAATPIDTVTPTLLLQRKRNSIPSPVPAPPKKTEEFVDLYKVAPGPRMSNSDTTLDVPDSRGYRRRRSSMKSTENSTSFKLQRPAPQESTTQERENNHCV